MTSVDLGETLSVNLPSISVIVPLVVPFSTTLAPITGPIWSSIIPVTVTVDCCGEATIKSDLGDEGPGWLKPYP